MLLVSSSSVSFFISLSLRVFSALSTIFLYFVVSRSLGQHQAGVFFLFFAYVMVASSVSRLGLDQYVLRKASVVHSLDKCGFFTSILFSFSLVFVLVGCFEYLLFYMFGEYLEVFGLNKDVLLLLDYGLFFLFIHCAISSLALMFQASGRIVISVVSLNVFPVFFTSLTIFIKSPTQAYDIVEILYCVYMIDLLFFLVVFLCYFGFNLDVKYIICFLYKSLSKCKNFLPILFLGMAAEWFPQLFAGFYVKTSDIAALSVAVKLSLLVSFGLTAVNFIIAPRFAQLDADNDLSGIICLSDISAFFSFALGFPIFLLAVFFGDYFISFFNVDYSVTIGIFIILACGQLFNVACGSVGYLLMMTGNERYQFYGFLISVPFGFLFHILFIHSLGVYATAISISIVVVLQNLIASIYVNKNLGFFPFLFFIRFFKRRYF